MRAREFSVTKRKITRHGDSMKEGKAGEDRSENLCVTSGNFLEPTPTVTCDYEYLLKPCASRQEKLSFCYKNGAARYAHIGDPRHFISRSQKKIAWPAHLNTLSQMHAMIGN